MTIVINGTTGITDVNGTAAAPAITGTDTDTGLYFGTNLLGLATGGTNALYIDASQNVGIGTTSPAVPLEVFGAITSYAKTSAGTTMYLRDYLGNYIAGWSAQQGVSVDLATRTSDPLTLSVNNSVKAKLDNSGNLQFNSGYGSVATAYGCRAWVNFNGTGTVAIRASGNVSSITDNGVGDYTVNFTTAMPDASYAVNAMTGAFGNGNAPIGFYESNVTAKSASLVRLYSSQGAVAVDGSSESVTVFR